MCVHVYLSSCWPGPALQLDEMNSCFKQSMDGGFSSPPSQPAAFRCSGDAVLSPVLKFWKAEPACLPASSPKKQQVTLPASGNRSSIWPAPGKHQLLQLAFGSSDFSRFPWEERTDPAGSGQHSRTFLPFWTVW